MSSRLREPVAILSFAVIMAIIYAATRPGSASVPFAFLFWGVVGAAITYRKSKKRGDL